MANGLPVPPVFQHASAVRPAPEPTGIITATRGSLCQGSASPIAPTARARTMPTTSSSGERI